MKKVYVLFRVVPLFSILITSENNYAQSSSVTLIGRWANGPCKAIAANGNIGYFGNGGYLEIVDFTTPDNPEELGKIVLPSLVEDVAISGNYGYVANGLDGLRIIDISNPESPKEAGFFDTGDMAKGIAISGNHVYVANGNVGLYILRNDLITEIYDDMPETPTIFKLSQNYPNPFNSATTISFNVQEATYVSLKVYDVTSKVIATLVDERKNAGQYSVKWDAGSISSGVY